MRQLRHIKPSDLKKYRKYYSELTLSEKVISVVDVVGEKLIIPILQGYYALCSARTPLKNKLLIMAGLGYFILPADMIPDVLGMFGFVDDLAVITFVLNQVQSSITPEIMAKAEEKYRKLLRRKHLGDEVSAHNA